MNIQSNVYFIITGVFALVFIKAKLFDCFIGLSLKLIQDLFLSVKKLFDFASFESYFDIPIDNAPKTVIEAQKNNIWPIYLFAEMLKGIDAVELRFQLVVPLNFLSTDPTAWYCCFIFGKKVNVFVNIKFSAKGNLFLKRRFIKLKNKFTLNQNKELLGYFHFKNNPKKKLIANVGGFRNLHTLYFL